MHAKYVLLILLLGCSPWLLGGCQLSQPEMRRSFSLNERGVTPISNVDYSYIFNDLADFLAEHYGQASPLLLTSERQHQLSIEKALRSSNIYVCAADQRCSNRLQVGLVPDFKEHAMTLIANFNGASISRQYQRSQLSYREVTPFSVTGEA